MGANAKTGSTDNMFWVRSTAWLANFTEYTLDPSAKKSFYAIAQKSPPNEEVARPVRV